MNDPNVIVRNFNPETDVLPLVKLRNELGQNVTEQSQLAELTWPNQMPEQDRWVAELTSDKGRLIAHGFGFHTIPERYLTWCEVHPDWQRRGIGGDLLARALTRGQRLGADHALVNPNASNEIAQAFLVKRGFWARSHAWFLDALASTDLAEPQWPIGYSVKSFAEVQDISVIEKAYFRCYGDMWGHGANSKMLAAKSTFKEGWKESWLRDWDPLGESIFLVFAPNGEVVGLCRAEVISATEPVTEKPKAHVDGPGIAPEHRKHKLQHPLVLAAMRWLQARLPEAAYSLSSFGDDEQTVDIYRALGFQLSEHLIAYHLDLKSA